MSAAAQVCESGYRYGWITDFLLFVAPDFCWCTTHDLLLMAEQIYEDVDENTFSVILSRLHKRGVFIKKPSPVHLLTPGKKPVLWLRVV